MPVVLACATAVSGIMQSQLAAFFVVLCSSIVGWPSCRQDSLCSVIRAGWFLLSLCFPSFSELLRDAVASRPGCIIVHLYSLWLTFVSARPLARSARCATRINCLAAVAFVFASTGFWGLAVCLPSGICNRLSWLTPGQARQAWYWSLSEFIP